MASAAAVGANAALSPPSNNLDEDDGLPGQVTSAIGSKEDGMGTNIDEDDDEDVRTTARRRGPVDEAIFGDQGASKNGGGVDDLFGDDEDGELDEEPEVAEYVLIVTVIGTDLLTGTENGSLMMKS